jgi:Heparinase II/III-like protein
VTLSGAGTGTTIADSSGAYTFSGLSDGAYTLTPSRAGYSFSPSSQNVTLSGANITGVNFTATAQAGQTFTISGTISPASAGSGATVTLSGAASATTIANSSGAFTFAGLSNGNYTVIPAHAGYMFSPSSLSAQVSGANVSGVNFTGSPQVGQMFSISGTISPLAGGSGAAVVLSGAGSASTTTDSSGAYTFTGVASGSYTVTPANSGYTFSPISQNVTVNQANVTGVNFTAASVGVSVSISPNTTTMSPGTSQNFTATVTGSANTAVIWTASGGSISGIGNTISYSAAGVVGTYTLTATSAADATRSAVVNITVSAIQAVNGLFIPTSHPRLFFNAARLAQAKTWYALHPFTPSSGDFDGNTYYSEIAFKHLVNGDDCSTAINYAVGYSPSVTGTASDDVRWHGEEVILVYDWCYDQMTTSQRSTILANTNTWVTAWMNNSESASTGFWGGLGMPQSNYYWGYLRNELDWGIASYYENTPSATIFLTDALVNRWQNSFMPFSIKVGPGGGEGGVAQEGSEYGPYVAGYSSIPLYSAGLMGRSMLEETDYFQGMAYWLIYATTPQQTKGWEIFPWSDDETWKNGSSATRQGFYPSFMTGIATYFSGSPLSQYARQWLATTGGTAVPWQQSVDAGGTPASFSALPLDYYASGYQYFIGRNQWSPNATTFLWQMGKPTGVGHQHHDWGTFQIWRNGQWLSRESVGYSGGDSVAGYGGSGSADAKSSLAHNAVVIDGAEVLANTPNVPILESTANYSHAVVNLNSSETLIREWIFVRSLETMVILDRLQTSSASSTKTFLLHSGVSPTLEDANHVRISNGSEQLRVVTLLPSTGVSNRVVSEGGTIGQYRVEIVTAPNSSQSYILTILQAKSATAGDLTPSVVDSNPGNPASGTLTVSLDGSHSILFNKGISATAGGSISIGGVTSSFINHAQTISIGKNGIVWGQ